MAFRPPDKTGGLLPTGLFASSLEGTGTGDQSMESEKNSAAPEFSTLEETSAPWEEFCDRQRAENPGISDVEIAKQVLSGDCKGDTPLLLSAYRRLQCALPFHQRDALIRTPHGVSRVKPHSTCESDWEDEEAVIVRLPEASPENASHVDMSPVRCALSERRCFPICDSAVLTPFHRDDGCSGCSTSSTRSSAHLRSSTNSSGNGR